MRRAFALLAVCAGTAGQAAEPTGLHSALEQLSGEGRFSGAVVMRDAAGIRFSRGYGQSDPFTGRAFAPHTKVDSGSLAKPLTAAAVLLLARERKLALDAPVRRYLAEYPHPNTTVRQLLSHSAGLPNYDALAPLDNKSGPAMLREIGTRQMRPAFVPGTRFSYCNICYNSLALVAEKVAGRPLLEIARAGLGFPAEVEWRPLRLSDWQPRAIGYRRLADGKLERADSYDLEAFYGSANLGISAEQLAEWGTQWWRAPLARLRPIATRPARIAGRPSGLTLGSWYCAAAASRCHYLGHHEGFHHMLYWDARRRISIAMVSNNSLAPALQQRLQRALVAFAEGRTSSGRRELNAALPSSAAAPGEYRLGRRTIALGAAAGPVMPVELGGIRYDAYPVSAAIRYVPGLDAYLSGRPAGRLHWLTLYDEVTAEPVQRR